MSLSGKIAAQRPDIDALALRPVPIVVHRRAPLTKRGAPARQSAADHRAGVIDPVTGVYRSGANLFTEAERRAAGIRRNGQLRRRPTQI